MFRIELTKLEVVNTTAINISEIGSFSIVVFSIYLQIISIRPSASTEEKFGASADTSQRYKPLDFKTKRFSITFTSLDDWCY